MVRYYSGIGSRTTPKEILELMARYAQQLASLHYILRSGGASGADSAFERGCNQVRGGKEIYLPWKGYNTNLSPLYTIPPGAVKIASELCGKRWKLLKRPVQKLMARNVLQILGKNLDTPSEFVICWTPDGCVSRDERTKQTGGTGQAIALADSLNIPIYNLYNESDKERLDELILKLPQITGNTFGSTMAAGPNT